MMLTSVWIFVFGALAPFWIQEFDLTRTRLGSLTMLLYASGALGSLVAGRVVDRLEGRTVLVGMFVLAGITILLLALTPNLAWIYAVGFIGGITLGCSNPATNKLIARMLPPGHRGGVMGIKQAGVQVGGFLTGALLPAATLVLGWRGALWVAVSLPVLGILMTPWLIPHDRPREDSSSPEGAASMPLGRLTGYAFLMGSGVAVLYVYLPLYAYEKVGASVTTAGGLIGLIGLTSIFGRLGWGRFGERFTHVSVPLLIIAIISVISTCLLWTAGIVEGSWLLWPAAVGFGLSATAWNVVGMLTIVAEADSRAVGWISGVVQFGFYGGFIVTPIAFGFSVDTSGAYDVGWAIVLTIFILSAGVAWNWRSTLETMPGDERHPLV